MTYNKIVLDESILELDSWLPQEAIDALTELVYDVEIDRRESNFEIFKLSEASLESINLLVTKENSIIKVDEVQYSEVKKESEFEYGIVTQEAA
ncbi:hypothetical protein HQ674_10935 [Enterococcus faecium]|uniref:hypothetical protein n=1 Tax=Enterococcus TaxID=1350 RepID=UPI000AFA8397|nr:MULTISPECIES: hypothetical protein [Enterococcus]MBE8861502.1 hypothetical protein [Enterococcus faecium]MDA5331964.1 hypothetical protein [Enterococcus lactis]MDK4370504.1 hypothetical protein [Enterococcus faecium]NTL72524.1 hypothetical protein [Enterococcus faecium]HAQ4436491.1 hypothetical protein [Enterococcus faecium]